MGASAVPIAVMTGICLIIGAVLPWFAPKGQNQGITQTVLITTGACVWIFWLCAYMCQMNPLIGPVLHNSTMLLVYKEWGGVEHL
ncbi:V-type proton ATPase subunit e 2-like [Artemia franciscana]|uniref:V-type proton ATPase subunit e 2-like n=1 Tax=Artemia franciscana TaxID=6661 RepID=UPI0032DA910C